MEETKAKIIDALLTSAAALGRVQELLDNADDHMVCVVEECLEFEPKAVVEKLNDAAQYLKANDIEQP